jgi:hypothetical protein
MHIANLAQRSCHEGCEVYLHPNQVSTGSSGEVLLTRPDSCTEPSPCPVAREEDNPPHRGRSFWGFGGCSWAEWICMGSNDQSCIIAVALHFSNNVKAALIRAFGAPGTEAAETDIHVRFQKEHKSRQKRKNSTHGTARIVHACTL